MSSTENHAQSESDFFKKQIEDLSHRLEDKIAELSIIKEMGEALAFIDDYKKTCHYILDLVIKHTLAQNFSIMLYDKEKQQLFLIAANSTDHDRFILPVSHIITRKKIRYSFKKGQGAAGRALEEGSSVLVKDAQTSSHFFTDDETQIKIGSLISVPMNYQDEVIGVINISHPQKDIFHHHDIYLFNILADFIALLVQGSFTLQRLKFSEEKYRALTENSNDGIAVIQDEKHIYANPKYQEITGYDMPKLGSITFDELLQPSGLEHEMYRGLDFHAASNTQLIKGILRTKEGEQIEVEANIANIKHNDEKAILVSLRDLSYRRQLERQLRQFQKMEAIGTLAGGVAHDFNNILSAIIGYTELASRKLPLSNPVHNYLLQVLKAGDRAKSLVKQILTFSRQTESEHKIVRVDLITKEALKLLRSTIPASIEMHHDISKDCFVMTEPTLIHQIVMNLCINASHAMKDGGELGVSLVKIDIDDSFNTDMRRGPYICLSVTDSGPGMDTAIQERIFEPYYTTKKQGVGTGMGLAVVHGIVKSHNGYITVDSSPEKGTSFDVYLPRIKQKKLEIAEASGDIPTGDDHILLVDDEESIVNMGKELLSDLGYTVTAVTSSETALQLFTENPDDFDLVITDQGMPKMKGTQLVPKLLAVRADLPIILCTGFSETINAEEISKIGIRRILMKPVLMKDLADAIYEVLHTPPE